LRSLTYLLYFNRISFSITLISYLNICLTSLITIRAIIDNAFKPSFKSINALLR
ncbi:hypothetical protein V2W45_1225919, partial [Cenococcum geophilum]